MRIRVLTLVLCGALLCPGVIIDRIAIVSGNAIVKDSDIDRDTRLTDLLNGQPLSLTPAARKSAAARLLDQTFIRQEIRAGDYPRATPAEAEKQLQQWKQHRFRTDQSYQSALTRYGVTDAEVRQQLQWQLTVLTFIDQRFKPAAYVSDKEVADYFDEHAKELRQQNPGKITLDQLRPEISDLLSAEKVNKLFFSWLDEQRENGHIKYHEEGLR